MTNKEALITAYKILTPYCDGKWWEFDSNLTHLNFITKYASKNKKIFDAGCGLGVLAMALKLLGYNISGGDKYIFEDNNDFSVSDKERLQNIWRQNGLVVTAKDIITDELGERYNMIISIATIEHQKDPKKFLARLKFYLADGGLLYIATPNQAHLLNRLRFLFGRSVFSSLKNFFENGESFVGHWREYTTSELKAMFKWLDLEIIFARSVQDSRPGKISSGRDVYVNLIKILSHLIPGSGQANIIIGKKK